MSKPAAHSGLSISIHDRAEPTHISTLAELHGVLESAGEEARARGMLNVIFLGSPNGNSLSMVVGGAETVLTFMYGHRNLPYYASRGSAQDPLPNMSCYVGLVHHTEFPRTYVVPYAKGLGAAEEFAASGSLPTSVEWVET
jgi:hypothetical protein